MSAGQGPAGGGDAERLAAAIEQGTTPRSVGDAELARDLEIVAMLRSRSAAFDPHPGDRARAKQRLMAALAQSGDGSGPPSAPHATELTAPLRPITDDTPTEAIAVTREPVLAQTAVISETALPEAAPAGATGTAVEDAPAVEAPDVAAAARPRRAGRHSLPSRPGGRARGASRPGRAGLRRRIVMVGAAALAAVLAFTGADMFSRDALPGDTLYAMKRLSESTATALTFDDQARAQRHLELATTRIDEVEQLVARGSAAGTAGPDAELVESAMREFDGSTGEGSRMLLASEDASGAAALGDLWAWAADQSARLSVLRSTLPVESLDEADSSLALLDRLLGRTEALEARSSCAEVTSSVVDDLGRLPAEGACSPRVSAPAPDGTSGTEDGAESSTTSTTPDTTDSTDPTTGDTTPPETSETGDDGVLPRLGTDGLPLPLPLPGTEGGSDDRSTDTAPENDDNVSIPLPLLPPVQLPPLLPGQPGVTIG